MSTFKQLIKTAKLKTPAEEVFADKAKGRVTMAPPSTSELDDIRDTVAAEFDFDDDELSLYITADTTGGFHHLPAVVAVHWPTATESA